MTEDRPMKFLADRSRLGVPALVFNFTVGLLGLTALIVATVLHGVDSPPPLPLAATFLGLFIAARFLRFELPPNITASLVVPMQLASIVLLGPVATAWLALLAFFAEVLRENPFKGESGRVLLRAFGVLAFNLGMEATITLTAGEVWRRLNPSGSLESWQGVGALVLTFGVFKLLNELLLLTGLWLQGYELGVYLQGARVPILIETLTLPLAGLLILMHQSPSRLAFILFVLSLLMAAAVVKGLTHARAELERRVAEIETLSEVSRAISSDIELERLLDTIKTRCLNILSPEHFFIALYSEGDDELEIALEVINEMSYDPQLIPLGSGLTSHVIQKREPLLVRDLVAEDAEGVLPARPLQVDDRPNRSWLGVPMVARGEAVGAIVLQDKESDVFDEHDLRVLLAIASQAAISVKNARLHREALQRFRIEAENRELKQLNAKKTEFVNMVAHQFRTPLTSVIGYANVLLGRARKAEAPTLPDLERHLETVQSESQRLSHMVEELLNLSRIRSGQLPLTFQSFDLNAVVVETLAAHQVLAEERGQTLVSELGESDAAEGSQLWARGDSNFIRQALANLVSNAIKYSPENSRIVVRSEPHEDHARLRVVDEGPGVPEEHLERVFEEFHRAPGATAERPGTGLGLSICRSIVEAHGGRTWAEQVGPGTAFCFELPGTDAEEPRGRARQATGT
ncbi:MAG: ATP-binding protein [Acidobacteriota bacterium]